MDRNDILINVQVNGINQLTALSNAMRQLNAAASGHIKAVKNLDAQQRALNIALGRSESSTRNHAKSLSQLLQNQSALGNELRRSKSDLTSYTTGFAKNTEAAQKNSKYLQDYTKSLKGIKTKALAEDLRGISVEMKRLGKDAQFTGRSMIIGLTTPIMAFASIGVESLVKVDSEMVRLNKLVEDMGRNMEDAYRKMGLSAEEVANLQPELRAAAEQNATQMVAVYNEVTETIATMSTQFGVSRDLVTSVTADFAELGLVTTDTALALTELVLAAEKLGSMDIGPSQALVQSMFQQASSAAQLQALKSGKQINVEDLEMRSLAVARGQLYLFNQVENATALSLRELADAFPEVAAAGTQFGLSMTQTAALLAPMKAAGFDIGTSVNSIKVSLQRLNEPTQKTIKTMEQLAQITGYDFQKATGLGLTALDALSKGYERMIVDAKPGERKLGQEAVGELFSSLFEKRQAPRMQVMIADLTFFNQALKETASQERIFADAANKILMQSTTLPAALKKSTKSFSDLGAIVAIATSEVGQIVRYIDETGQQAEFTVTEEAKRKAQESREEVAKMVEDARKRGDDLLARVKSQSGKAFFVEYVGPGTAQARAETELATSLDSLKVSMDRLKNSFKNIATQIIEPFRPVFEWLSDTLTNLAIKFREMGPGIKVAIASFLTFLAALGPLVFAFGQARLAMATMSNALLKFAPGLSHLTAESLAAAPGLLRLKKPVQLVGESFETSASRLQLFIAKLASGTGPVANFSRRIGEMTGVLSKNKTIAADVAARLPATAQVAQVGTTRAMQLAGGVAGLSQLADASDAAEYQQKLIDQRMKQMGVPKTTRKTGGGRMVNPYYANALKFAAEDVKMQQLSGLLPDDFEDFTQREMGRRFGSTGKRSLAKGRRDFRIIGKAGSASQAAALGGMTYDDFSQQLAQRTMRGSQAGMVYGDFGARYRGRGVSERAERAITGGGIRATTTKAVIGTKMAAESAAKKTAGAITSGITFFKPSDIKQNVGKLGKTLQTSLMATTGPISKRVNIFGKAMEGAKASQAKLAQGFVGFSGAPTKFQKITAAVTGFGGGLNKAVGFTKLFSKAFMSIGILAVITAIAAGIMMIVNAFKKGGSEMEKVKKTFSEAFAIIWKALKAIFAPIVNAVTMLAGLGEKAGSTSGGFQKVANAVKSIAQGISDFITKYVVPLITFIMTQVVDVIRGVVKIVKGFINIFKGNFREGLGMILKGIAHFARVALNVFFKLVNAYISLWAAAAKAIISLFFKSIGALGGLLKKLPGPFKSIGRGIENAMKSANKAVNGAVDSLADMAKKGVNAVRDVANSGLEKAIGKQLQVDAKAKARARKVGKELGEEVAETANQATGDSIDLANQIKDAVEDALKDLSQRFVDLVLGGVKESMDKAVSDLTSALEKQKESALDAFNQQIEGLEQLQKAEESLTRERQYQADRRRLIQERELQVQNFQRDRALAIYEGRIDDARVLGLQEVKNAQDFTANLENIDESRRRDLAQENLDALRNSIEKAREEANKFFDDQIEKFKEAAAEITKFGPKTIEEYQAQLDQLNQIASDAAEANGEEFATMVQNMVRTIGTQIPNEAVPTFSNSLDQLIAVAQQKYGFSPNGLNGALVAALQNMGATINNSSINANFLSIIEGMKNGTSIEFARLKDQIVAPALEEISAVIRENNPFNVFEEAIKNANDTLLDELQRTVGSTESKVRGLIGRISDALRLATMLDARTQAIESFVSSGEGGGPSGAAGPGVALVSPFLNWILSRIPIKGIGVGALIGANSGGPTSPPTQRPTRPRQTPRYYGGMIQKLAQGGMVVPGFNSSAVPAILHGGEYVVNAAAVRNIGVATLNNLNNMRFRAPSAAGGVQGMNVSSSSSVNIYVENFIGEDQWFNEMVKKYNMTVLPNNQKKVGLEERRLSSYNGLSRGM